VKRLVTWIAGAAGGMAAYRAAKRRKPAAVPAVEREPDPAEELRAKLAETRAKETTPEGPDDRRRAVHEQARAAIDEMREET
jgi:ParB-like chromosome segregation protein Spo0J